MTEKEKLKHRRLRKAEEVRRQLRIAWWKETDVSEEGNSDIKFEKDSLTLYIGNESVLFANYNITVSLDNVSFDGAYIYLWEYDERVQMRIEK